LAPHLFQVHDKVSYVDLIATSRTDPQNLCEREKDSCGALKKNFAFSLHALGLNFVLGEDENQRRKRRVKDSGDGLAYR
jgi:hypothetical protein